MNHLCKYRKYLKACTMYDLRNKSIQKEESSCLQGSAGLHGINPIPQVHSPHFPESPGICLMPVIFLISGDLSFLYHGYSAWMKISGSEAKIDFWTIILTVSIVSPGFVFPEYNSHFQGMGCPALTLWME